MASIYVFCELAELRDWIVQLCAHEDLGIIYYHGTEGIATCVEPLDFHLEEGTYQIFLFPRECSVVKEVRLNDVQQREWGWLNIRPGGIKSIDSGSCLLYSEIHGERGGLPGRNPERWVKWLRSEIGPMVQIGVLGKNTITGGSTEYMDILYTRRAARLFTAGVVWKQFASGNTVFEPLP